MERRTALALAAAAAGTVLAGSAAFAANVGLLEDSSDTPVGLLDATSTDLPTSTTATDPTVVTVIVEDPPPSGAAAVGTRSPAPPAVGADDSYEDDSHEDDSYEDDSYDDEVEHEDEVEVEDDHDD